MNQRQNSAWTVKGRGGIVQLPPGDQSAYRRDRLKSGTPPPDRRLSWIPSGTVSKVLTVSTLAHLPCIAIWLGNELCVALCYLVGQVIGGICFRKGSVCVLGMSHSTLKLHYSHPCMDVQNPPFFSVMCKCVSDLQRQDDLCCSSQAWRG